MPSACLLWTERLLCTDISTQPLVVGGAVVMVPHSCGSDSEPPQQDPVQLALHEADSQKAKAGIVQCDGLHRIKRICEACTVNQVVSLGVRPCVPITPTHFLVHAFQHNSSPAIARRRATLCAHIEAEHPMTWMPCDPALLRSAPTWICHISADVCRDTQRCQTAVAGWIRLSACNRDKRMEA